MESCCSFVGHFCCCQMLQKKLQEIKTEMFAVTPKVLPQCRDNILSSQRVKEQLDHSPIYSKVWSVIIWTLFVGGGGKPWAVKEASEVTNKLLPDLRISLSSLVPGYFSVLSRECLSPGAREHGLGWLSQLRADLHCLLNYDPHFFFLNKIIPRACLFCGRRVGVFKIGERPFGC